MVAIFKNSACEGKFVELSLVFFVIFADVSKNEPQKLTVPAQCTLVGPQKTSFNQKESLNPRLINPDECCGLSKKFPPKSKNVLIFLEMEIKMSKKCKNYQTKAIRVTER